MPVCHRYCAVCGVALVRRGGDADALAGAAGPLIDGAARAAPAEKRPKGAGFQWPMAMDRDRRAEFATRQEVMAAAHAQQLESLVQEKLDHLGSGDAR